MTRADGHLVADEVWSTVPRPAYLLSVVRLTVAGAASLSGIRRNRILADEPI